MEKPTINKFTCDVLCIGGSGAAVSAAYMAGKQNQKVILVSKGKAGRSGNAIMVGGGFGIDGYNSKHVLGQEQADETYTPEKLMEKIIKCSFYLSDQKLVRQFVTDAAPMLKIFLEWAKNANQKLQFVRSGLFTVSGNTIGNTISQGIRETPNLTVFNDVAIIDLLTEENRIVGAVGLDIYTGEYIHIEAKSVVVATGGYQPYSLKNTNTDMTGDGMAMVLRAGGKVADMEFHLFIPTAVSPGYLRGSILPYLFTIPVFMPLSYEVVDANGKHIELPGHFASLPASNKAMKLVYSYFWSQGASVDVMQGGLFYDYSSHTDAEIEAAFDHLIKHYSQWHREGMYNGINLYDLRDKILKERKLEFALGNEYSNGGVVVDDKMATSIEGLYAAGETTSGLFGAMRAGDGLSEMLAQGYRAGLEAAEYASKLDNIVSSQKQAQEVIDSIEKVFNQSGNLRSEHLFNELSKQADSGFGVIRNEKGMQTALQNIESIAKDQIAKIQIPDKSRRYNLDLHYYLQLRNLLLCTKAGLLAALERRESRGTHVRSDYKGVNNTDYLYRITSKLEGDKLVTGKLVPDTSYLEPPKGNYDSIPDYLNTVL